MKIFISKLTRQKLSPRLVRAVFVVLASLLLPGSSPVRADEIGEKGRSILEKNKNAVVTIQLVMKIKVEMKGYNQPATEVKQDITGMIIDSSGLTVTALAGTDPGQIYENTGDGDSKPKWRSELTDVKILSPDGTEIPVEVVLRDKDLDLAFLRPTTKPDAPTPFIDLNNAVAVQTLDQVISINRLGKVSQRVHSASVERINAVVTKPKKFYIPGSELTTTRMGCPAFALDGKLVGLFVTRTAKGRSGGSASFSAADNFAAIILPADDIHKVAQQAPASAEKPKEDKKEEPKEEEKAEKK